ncbi:MAG TPA: NADH-ubiquinone oxidoreductase-F iron-sulfur binding region domain-containing protein, partial [Pseudonocardiaceae bacterium]
AAPLQAVLVGGYHGGWLPTATAGHVPLSPSGLRPLGVSLGAGVVVALPRAVCGLRESVRIAAYLAGQSAGQCGPCRFGLPALAGALARLADGGHGPEPAAELDRLTRLVDGRGACHHPDGTARFVRSNLAVFDAGCACTSTGAARPAEVPDELATAHRLDRLRRPRAVYRTAAGAAGPGPVGLPGAPCGRA